MKSAYELADKLDAEREMLIRGLGSIARGRNGRPLTGKDAQWRARQFLEACGIDWQGHPIDDTKQ